jgi:hypothetical protein
MTEGEKKPSFKVVDRRRFTDEGDERSGPDVPTADPVRTDKAPPAASAASSLAASASSSAASAASSSGSASAVSSGSAGSSSAPAAAAPKKPKAQPSPGGLTFSMFLQSLAQQALMQMGLIPWPHGQRELTLEQARDTIDILELLKAKTEGNLDAEEQQLMDTVVQELKMSFVEVQQAIARSRGGMKPPGMPGMPR